MYLKEYKVTHINTVKSYKSTSNIAMDETILLYVNNKQIATMASTPEQLEQLVVGHLVCEGVVNTFCDIKDIKIDNSNRIFARITPALQHNDIKVKSDTHFNYELIISSLHYLESKVYHQTRGTHAACIISSNGRCIANAVDIGRHNAVDKAIGQALMDGFNPNEHFILSSGRQPVDMVLKAARVGIPLIVTKAAPLSSGIVSAYETGICLIGFAQKNSMSVFSHEWRLDGSFQV